MVAVVLIERPGTIFTAPADAQAVLPGTIDRSGTMFVPNVATPGVLDQTATIFPPRLRMRVFMDFIDQKPSLFVPETPWPALTRPHRTVGLQRKRF